MEHRAPNRDSLSSLSYANAGQPRLKRWFIRTVEGLSGRKRYEGLYNHWRRDIVPGGDRVFGRMLDLVEIGLDCKGVWPPATLPDTPLVIIANHPFGIGDGIAILSLAEQLGRPFRVMLASDLLKIDEMRPYSLPVNFDDSKEAMKNNLAVRHEALRLLKEGVTIVIFPAGGVATSPSGFGKAEDLPWKMFVARLVQDAKASVIPMFFCGQNGRLFHVVSRPMNLAESEKKLVRTIGNVSLTLRLSLLVREFTRLSGKRISVHVGTPISWEEMASMRDRKALIGFLHRAVFSLAPAAPSVRRSPRPRLHRRAMDLHR